MFGDPKELAESRLLARVAALTVADGLPSNFGLVTRELKHFTEISATQLPGCLIQLEEDDAEIVMKLSGVKDVSMPGRIVVLFAPDTTLPATTANAYRHVLEKAIEDDMSLGGAIDSCWVTGGIMPGIWEGTSLLGMGLKFRMLYEYLSTLPARTA